MFSRVVIHIVNQRIKTKEFTKNISLSLEVKKCNLFLRCPGRVAIFSSSLVGPDKRLIQCLSDIKKILNYNNESTIFIRLKKKYACVMCGNQ